MAAPLLKICGLKDPHQAAAVAELGADAIGVIGVPASPRFVGPGLRPTLFNAVSRVRQDCLRVLVVADPCDDDLPDLDGDAGGHNVLQLHGSETPERCLELRHRLTPEIRLWKALRIRQPQDLEKVSSYGAVVDALLLDAWVSDQLGGTGQRVPLEWLLTFRSARPWWLAGGITAERVEGIRDAIVPTGLDASSGVEDRPGIKNMEQVAALIQAVKGKPWPGR